MNSGGAILLNPPKKIIKGFYECGKTFQLDPILEMYKDENSLGIVFISGTFFGIYKVIKTGDHVESKKLFIDKVNLAKKHKKGGSSSMRFCRLQMEGVNNYITKVSEKVISCYMTNNNTNNSIGKLIIAGSGKKKNRLGENDLILQYFKNKITLLTIAEINEETIKNTINNINFDIESNNKFDVILNDIQNLISQANDKLVFGIREINKNLRNLEKIIIIENLRKEINSNINSKCQIIEVPDYKLEKLGLNAIGIKWY